MKLINSPLKNKKLKHLFRNNDYEMSPDLLNKKMPPHGRHCLFAYDFLQQNWEFRQNLEPLNPFFDTLVPLLYYAP